MSRENQFDNADDGDGADTAGNKVVSTVIKVHTKVVDWYRSACSRFSENDLQKPEQENPRQRNLLSPIRSQGPDHRHRQAQNHNISKKIANAAANGKADSIHAFRRLGYLEIPEGIYWHALKDACQYDGDPPGDDDDGVGVDGYSETTRGKEETIVEQE